jgi:hypothetical protein
VEKKAFQFEVKELQETGDFVGFASVYGIEDLGGDMVMPGAFTRTIQQNPEVVILWQHDPYHPIGLGKLEDSPQGLIIRGKLNLDVTKGREAYSLLKQGAIKGLSIGYDTITVSWAQEVRQLLEVRLWEVSVVTFPMLPIAQVTSVKQALSAFSDLPVAKDVSWDAAAAQARVLEWAGNDREKLTKGFLYVSGEERKFAIADIVNGSPVVVPAALSAAAAELKASDLPEAVKHRLTGHLSRYFAKSGMNVNEPTDNKFERLLRKLTIGAYIEADELKVGRVLSAQSLTRVQTAIDALSTLLTNARPAAKPDEENEDPNAPEGGKGGTPPEAPEGTPNPEGGENGGAAPEEQKNVDPALVHSTLRDFRQFLTDRNNKGATT